MRNKHLCIIVISLLSYSCKEKIKDTKKPIPSYNVIIKYLDDSNIPKKGDYVYTFFENGFLNDSIDVFYNGESVYTGEITTDYSLGLAKSIELGKLSNTKEVSFRINNGNEVVIKDLNHNFLKINYIKDTIVEVDVNNVFIQYH